jgi:type II secretory pathway pseudopilin PulG
MRLKSLYSNKNEEGIGLVEVIVSLGIALVVVTAMISLSVFTLRTSTQSELLMESTRMANQQLERVRAARDVYSNVSSWGDFYNELVGSNCSETCSEEDARPACYIDDSYTPQADSTPPTNSDNSITTCFFVEEVDDGTGGTDNKRLDVTAVSTWEIGGERKYTHSYTRLSNWQN